jgi:sec-independent protein translocase protein TatA
MGALQWQHWLLILVVVLLLFGSTRLPGLAKSVGQSMKIFRKEIKDLRDDKSENADGGAADDAPGTQPRTSTGSTASSTATPTDKGGDAPKA